MVESDREEISDQFVTITNKFRDVQDAWVSPSAASFEQVSQWFDKSSKELLNLLDDAKGRLRTAYQNYHSAEETNVKNLS
jgi:uncharacterized protein YukE